MEYISKGEERANYLEIYWTCKPGRLEVQTIKSKSKEDTVFQIQMCRHKLYCKLSDFMNHLVVSRRKDKKCKCTVGMLLECWLLACIIWWFNSSEKLYYSLKYWINNDSHLFSFFKIHIGYKPTLSFVTMVTNHSLPVVCLSLYDYRLLILAAKQLFKGQSTKHKKHHWNSSGMLTPCLCSYVTF